MDWSAISAWDYVVGIIFLLSTLFGLFRGLISTVFGLVAWAAAVFCSWWLAAPVAQALDLQAPSILVRVGLFFGVYIVIRLLGYAIAKSLSATGLGGLDKPLGALFGALRGLFIVTVLVVALQWTGASRWVPWEGSVSRPLLDAIALWAKQLAPAREPAPAATST
jgi:membrane protein required for colicin V production